jgi:tRNA (guanine37-N1)-methyltransferase
MTMPAFDVIGEIAIAEIPKDMKTRDAAKLIMEKNNHIKSVYKKGSARLGEFRTRKLRLIGGEKISETVHKENGLQFKLDVKKCYFSPREGTERMRIVERVNELNPNAELFMTFFCGIGPTPITIAKKTQVKQVAGIDLNPDAIKYFKENISINKISNATAICGDVKKEIKSFTGKCDFISMPLPETSWKFLSYAIKCLKPNGVCFFYAFSPEDDLGSKWLKKIEAAAKKQNRKIKILEIKKVLPYASRIWKTRIDFSVV